MQWRQWWIMLTCFTFRLFVSIVCSGILSDFFSEAQFHGEWKQRGLRSSCAQWTVAATRQRQVSLKCMCSDGTGGGGSLAYVALRRHFIMLVTLLVQSIYNRYNSSEWINLWAIQTMLLRSVCSDYWTQCFALLNKTASLDIDFFSVCFVFSFPFLVKLGGGSTK